MPGRISHSITVRHAALSAAGLVLILLGACAQRSAEPAAPPTPQTPALPEPQWIAERLQVVEGLNVPESCLPDPAQGVFYVSNIETSTEDYWGEDGKAFISRVGADGKSEKLRWVDSRPGAVLNSPKGMGLLGGFLYVADVTRLLRYDVATAGAQEVIAIPGAKMLNDVATDGQAVYVSDTGANKVFRVEPKGGCRAISDLPSANGITFLKDRMYGVSWGAHEVYELDPAGAQAPKPFGLADNFKSLDGIEVLDDGTFLVSDLTGNKVCAISPDRKTVRTLVEVESPSDIGLDRTRGLLYVPQFSANKAAIYRLKLK
jgi:sugar lactone lactonase YvrE